jgi:hypothetical protein
MGLCEYITILLVYPNSNPVMRLALRQTYATILNTLF